MKLLFVIFWLEIATKLPKYSLSRYRVRDIISATKECYYTEIQSTYYSASSRLQQKGFQIITFTEETTPLVHRL